MGYLITDVTQPRQFHPFFRQCRLDDFSNDNPSWRHAKHHPAAAAGSIKAGSFHHLSVARRLTRAPGHPLVKIFTDPVSQPTGQFLAEQLYKATGWQFIVATTTNGMTIRNGILLTTVNANTNLGAEGYELTVAPDSVVIRAQAQGGSFLWRAILAAAATAAEFSSLLPATNVVWTVPCVIFTTSRVFAWRGTMPDCARHVASRTSSNCWRSAWPR